MIIQIGYIITLLFDLYAIYSLYDAIINFNKKKHLQQWYILIMVLSLFLCIFSLYSAYYIYMDHLNDIVVTFIILYIFSSSFVLFIVKRSCQIINDLKQKEINFSDMILKLGYEGKQKTIELQKKVEELENTRSAILNLLEDTTEQKNELIKSKAAIEKMASYLEKSNKQLLELDQQKDQFTSITAHELKTPLASIHGFAQLLQNREISGDASKREKYIAIILQDTERLSKLITDILDVTKLDLGTLKFYLEEIDIHEFMQDFERQISLIVSAKKIDISYIFENIPQTKFMVDKNRLAQVLSNLINNSIHYTPEGGKIEVQISTDGSNILFGVKDNGAGIPKSAQDKIFTRFYQADSWLTRKIGGSGLGLSISKGIINGLGGDIWFESEEGKGTTFYFTLPLKGNQQLLGEEKSVNILKQEKS